MQRIFYLITELDIGGAEKCLYELATRLDRRTFEPVVGCLAGHGVVGQWLDEAGIEVIHINMKSWWDLPAWLRLRKALREQKPHVLHSFLFHANIAGKLAAIGTGIKQVICSVRVEEPRRLHLCLDRLTRGLASVITCVSESSRRYTHEHTGVPLSKLVVIPNGIDPERCDAPVMAVPETWRLPGEAPVVASIGRLDEQKDPVLMLHAAAEVIREMPETVFVFAGTGPLAQACRAKARELGIAEGIRWLGWVEDIRPLLARMNLLALSSKWEGMPNVVLEAMACRKPVVATNVGGSGELIENGENGFLVEPGNAHALAERIIQLLRDRTLRAKLGNSAQARVIEHFSLAQMVEANQHLYLTGM